MHARHAAHRRGRAPCIGYRWPLKTSATLGGGMAATKRRWLSLAGILLFAPTLALAQQSSTITGRATGEAGAPLAAVTITLPELGLGALTREDGRYSITVPGARV